MEVRAANDKLRIVVAALAGSFPMAGTALHWLQYVLGFRALGHDVHYLEDAGGWFYDPTGAKTVRDVAVPLSNLARLMEYFDLSDKWTFIDEQREQYGVTGIRFHELLTSADLLVHVTGAMSLNYDERYLQIPARIYIDTDPGFIQARIANGSRLDREHLDTHTAHFSFGCNIGKRGCGIPSTGHNWHATVQPIFLPLWDHEPFTAVGAPFTTIVKWDAGGHAPMMFGNQMLGAKDVEFAKFVELPQLTGRKFEIAMLGSPPIENLEKFGWHCRNGAEISSTIPKYQNYLSKSVGEWSMAKHGYVVLNTGWFSDRSAGYLASGRPVVIQSTGFDEWLPCGKGVLTFRTLAQASEAIRLVDSAPQSQMRAAREMALTFFDSSKVLSRLIDLSFTQQATKARH
jgi:hypothetical protein